MVSFTFQEVIDAVQPSLIKNEDAQAVFTGISTDTREIIAGSLFLALKGENFDGHDFLAQAVEKGAAGIIAEKEPAGITEVPVFVAADSREALQGLARLHRLRYDIPVAAVTGSNGKTTTKDMLASVLKEKFQLIKTEKNLNNEIGLSKTLLQLNETHEACVVEMGMRGFGQIRSLAATALPTIGIVTNVGTSHIELLGSQEGIAKAKGELIEALPDNGVAVLNGDDPYVRAMHDKTKGKCIYYGIHGDALDCWAEDIVYEGRETRFAFCTKDCRIDIQMPVSGEHNVYDALAALSAAGELGVSPEQMKAGLKAFQASPMRQELVRLGEVLFVNDAYNANPSSMEESLKAVKNMAEKRVIAVLGDMLELGDTAKAAHCHIGTVCRTLEIDGLITVGNMAKYIAEEAGDKVACYAAKDHADAAEYLKSIVQKGDTVLLKGSRSMKMETVLALFERM